MASEPGACMVALDTVGRLQRELATLASYLDEVRDLLCDDARGVLLVDACAHVILTAQQLHRYVLRTADGTDESCLETQERALVARLHIAMRSLYALKQNELWIPRDAFSGRFGALRDVHTYLVGQLVQLHDRWQEQRRLDQVLDAKARQTIAYMALDEAEIAFECLGRDIEIARFLREGATSACDAVANACREIAAAVRLVLHARPERVLAASSSRGECAS